MALRLKKTMKRRRQTRKASRKMRRRQRGGGTYTFTVATPITATSVATGFPADLGTFSAGSQSITFTNPTKMIQDIKINVKPSASSTTLTPTTASSYTTSSGTKVSIKIGSVQNLVPNGISVNGTTPLPGATVASTTAPIPSYTGVVTIKNLNTSSFGTLQSGSLISFTVMTP